MWFCYEKNFANRWIPMIYMVEPLTSAVGGKEQVANRSTVWKLGSEDTEWILDDVEFMMRLEMRYPPPKEIIDGKG